MHTPLAFGHILMLELQFSIHFLEIFVTAQQKVVPNYEVEEK